jgi:putative ABC transport system permease protein
LGIATAISILMTGLYLRDALNWLMEVQFERVQRQDVTLVFNQPRPARTRYALTQLPGVLRSEVFRSVPVRLRFQHYHHRLAVLGVDPEGSLRQLLDRQLNSVNLPPDGLVLTQKLGEILHVKPGQTLTLEVLESERPVRQVQVVGIVDEFLGTSAYMDLAALKVFGS